MFFLASLIGIYSYMIFFLGTAGLLYKNLIIGATFLIIIPTLYLKRKNVNNSLRDIQRTKGTKNKILLAFLFLLTTQAFINLIGALGPELAFDALWYHLTLPKIWLANHTITFIPGGLLYYSAMPKLGEMLYIAGLAFGNDITVKLIHFTFGLLSCLALYKVARKFFSPFFSLLAVLIFYSNLVVSWESITAYVDLIRTFFEVMALWAFINWSENFNMRWLILSAVMIGFAITTKLLAIGSLLIFLAMILFKTRKILLVLLYAIISLTVPIPWLIFSYINTGNPIYPIFSNVFKSTNEGLFDMQLLSPINFILTSWNVFTQAADPLSPIYIIFLPIIIALLFKARSDIKMLYLYSLLGFLFWYTTSKIEGSRLLMPYIPALSILCAFCINYFRKYKNYSKFLLFIIIFVALISTCYRLIANSKYIPVLIGNETKHNFLTNHLNFSFGDFYDTDNYFKKNIKPNDKILLFGSHNLYYVDFPFIDSTWIRKGERFNYIAVQNTDLPWEFSKWDLIYTNTKTHVKLYSLEGGKWESWK